MANLRDVVIDCAHPASLARFWAAMLDGYAVAPYDAAEIERLRSIGIDDIDDDPGVIVEGPLGSPRFYFQLVPEPKVAKNRVHIDLWANDPDREVARLLALGATRHDVQPESGDWVTLADPEGNELCIVPRPS
jgi:hypothetical protein